MVSTLTFDKGTCFRNDIVFTAIRRYVYIRMCDHNGTIFNTVKNIKLMTLYYDVPIP